VGFYSFKNAISGGSINKGFKEFKTAKDIGEI
jgi:hypothetical protein